MAVLDTMVFAYAALRLGPLTVASERAIALAGTIVVPDLVFGELAESMRRWVVAGEMPAELAPQVVDGARLLAERVVPVPQLVPRALELALARNHSVYDALFVAVAELHGTRVVTFDRKVIERFPEWTVHATEFTRDPA